eukprot:IDg4135t1
MRHLAFKHGTVAAPTSTLSYTNIETVVEVHNLKEMVLLQRCSRQRIEKKSTSNKHLDNQKRAQKELRDAKKAKAKKRSREREPIAVMTARAARLGVPVRFVREPNS